MTLIVMLEVLLRMCVLKSVRMTNSIHDSMLYLELFQESLELCGFLVIGCHYNTLYDAIRK